MKGKVFKAMMTATLFLVAHVAMAAPGYVHVTNVSKLHYQVFAGGTVFFRNLNEFDAAVTGCCYAFALDTTTAGGSVMWSTILMKMASGGDLYLYVSERNPPTSGNAATIQHLGNW
ncbi:hypothetical protein [Reinekea sp. G2M2-21]|uniref:hypothetical protein n=1 Tax=Reinekea sp. G2M2-21 TaxID=2788942 RepID=UPI0018AC5587|nr:hypothetical protein [Reinekea sp. G2M2-21]